MQFNAQNTKVELTGNPFVDTGLGVLASLANLDNVQELSFQKMREVHNRFEDQLMDTNEKINSFTMIFTKNSLLVHPSMKPKEARKPAYKAVVRALLDSVGKESIPERCEACGNEGTIDFAELCNSALNSISSKERTRSIGRDWFPLSGSLGSDAQALPAASRPVHLCSKCLFAVHYLPLGLMLLEGKLAVFQSTSIDFWYEIIRDLTYEILNRTQAGMYKTLGQKESSGKVVSRFLNLFDKLQRDKRMGDIPMGANLVIWRFTNSGASPDCQIEEIPNPVLIFLWDAVRYGMRKEIEGLIEKEGKNPNYSIFRCIAERRDYPGLYPSGKKSGASPLLYSLYQIRILEKPYKAIESAYMLARKVSNGTDPKAIKRLQREEAFKEMSTKSLFRKTMVDLVKNGEFTFEEYCKLFPRELGSGVSVKWDGWDNIRYYLNHTQDSDRPQKDLAAKNEGIPMEFSDFKDVYRYSWAIFDNYTKERGNGRFEKEVLEQMGRGTINAEWLCRQFVRLAEDAKGFTYVDWEKLCKKDNGSTSVFELLFQMRLLWTQWLYQGRPKDFKEIISKDNTFISKNSIAFSGLPEPCQKFLTTLYGKYIERIGIERFYRDVLIRLRRKEIGLYWFRDKILSVSELEENEFNEMWEDFLIGDDGRAYPNEMLFQLRLALANLYRENKS